MELIYQSLLSFEFRHEYFRNLSATFTYVPQKETLELMRKKGLLFKKTENGFTILYQAIKGQGEQLIPLRRLPEEFAFRFWIIAIMPHAGIVSDLPLMRAASRTRPDSRTYGVWGAFQRQGLYFRSAPRAF